MIERYVFVKLKPQFSSDAGRKEAKERTLEMLDGVPGVQRLIVGSPADKSSTEAWDLSIVAVFETYEAMDAYLVHPGHKKYVNEYLNERIEVIKYWNFAVEVRDPK